MLTILGGEWGGQKLKVPDRETLRPSSARVKAAIFSIIEAIQWKRAGRPDFNGWSCLDLFAGVGGLGLEILSRGAERCVFVEKDRRHAQALEWNISHLGCSDRTTLIVGDVMQAKWSSHAPFHLILLDPPYADSNLPKLLEQFAAGNLLYEGGLVVFEHDPSVRLVCPRGLALHSERKLGPAGISVFIRNEG